MGKVQGKRKKAKGQRLKSRFVLPFAFCLLPSSLVLAGCTTPNRATTGDPLFGGPGLRPSAAQAAPQGAAPVAALPPVPATNSGLSTAALAAGGPRQFDRDRDLRISNPGNNAANDGWAGQTAGPRGEGAGAVLRGPEATVSPASRQESGAGAPSGPSSPSRPATYELAQAQLEARGVLWQRLEKVSEAGEWRFVCSVSDRQNPNKHHTYEARAHDYLSTIQAVIEQMDQNP
jgi:hypothetical protein